MDKNRVIYILLLIAFVIFVVALDISFYTNYSNVSGDLKIHKKFYDVSYIFDSDNMNYSDNKINVNLNNIDEDIFFDIYNSGNISTKLISSNISNINTNLEEENITIRSSLNENEIIKGGEIKRVYLYIDCNICTISESTNLSFSIEYIFGE